jgi:CubicO group peptidase (beta-lactamase class C family)
MKVRSTASLLVVLILLLNFNVVYAQSGSKQAKVLKFDKEKFIATVNKNKLGGGILDGYAAVVLKDGSFVTEVAGGFAIRGNDKVKNVAMTTLTPNHIGSAFKAISFISILSVFEKRAAKYPGLTVEKQLDEPIISYLPKTWRFFIINNQNSDVARIANTTFRQLMMHKSGFRTISFPNGTKPSPFNYISSGIKQANVGVRQYANFNATVITYLLPKLVDPVTANEFDKQVEAKTIANNDHEFYGKLYGNFFENWMQKNVFDVLLPAAIHPSCDPAVDFPKRNPPVTFARFYETPLGGQNPAYWSEKDINYGCHAQGGYYLNVRQLAAFMANYQATNTLISDKTRDLIYDDSTPATQDARLVWDGLDPSPFAKEHFGVNGIPYKLGSGANAKLIAGYSNTAILLLPGGYIAVGTMTSKGDPLKVYEGLKVAWGEAIKGNFE